MRSTLFLFLGALTIFAAVGLFFLFFVSPTDPEGIQACTLEAKICPDGTIVGRTGPQCAFAPCPGE